MKCTSIRFIVSAYCWLFFLLLTNSATAEKAFDYESLHYGVRLAAESPVIEAIWVDSLGHGKKQPGNLATVGDQTPSYTVTDTENSRTYTSSDRRSEVTFTFSKKTLQILTLSKGASAPEVTLKFVTKGKHGVHATLLGKMDTESNVHAPALLHLPGQGTFEIRAQSNDLEGLRIGYHASEGEVAIILPSANADRPRLTWTLSVVRRDPAQDALSHEKRYDAFRRGWLNLLQLSPRHKRLSNHAGSEVCGFCYHEYSEVAMLAGELTDGVTGPELLRDSLERILAGKITYGMPGHTTGDFPVISLDTRPSELIAAHNYYQATEDKAWVEKHIDKLIEWGRYLISTDSNGNGLIEYAQSGNFNECKQRPANWWDCINFGHEDAYSNVLAYRGYIGLAKLAAVVGRNEVANEFNQEAAKLKASYYDVFYNPKTKMLAGWKSRDGNLHDYAFTFIQGMAITYGVVDDPERANGLMDAILAKFEEVGYESYAYGIPGNLICVPDEEYYDRGITRWGGGNAFQIYENGGASANHVYFTLAALYSLGRTQDADVILFPILNSFNELGFQGTGNNGEMTNDWRAWDGTPWGYEGFLSDNYLTLKAVLVREGLVDSRLGNWKK